MTLLTRIKMLCVQNNTTISKLEKELEFGNGTISRWDNATPSGDRLAKVADYFNVSVDYLLGREDAEELNNVYFSLAKEAEQDGIDPRDIKMAIDMIKKLRGEQ